jgi:rRNA biogenesis protein RRP5
LSRRRILLTAKKSLLNSDLHLLTSYSQSILGKCFHGTIFSLTAHGALVEFYSGVKGYLPVSEMSEAYVADATEYFRIGQTVKAWILSVEDSGQRMRLSLRDQTYWSQGGQSAFEALEDGSIVTATVSAKLPDKVVIDIPSGNIQLRGVITMDHLADEPSKGEKKLLKIREGSKLKEVLVLSKKPNNRIIACSMKPALIESAREGTLPIQYEDLYPGQKITGWVKNVEDFGVFIGFGGFVEGVVQRRVIF